MESASPRKKEQSKRSQETVTAAAPRHWSASTDNKENRNEIVLTSDSWEKCINRVILPVLLILFTPNLVMSMWFCAVHCQGSFQLLFEFFSQQGGLFYGLYAIWSRVSIGSPFSLCVIFGYCTWALILMKIVPGPRVEGTQTPKGNTPIYTDNGFYCYLITLAAFSILTIILKYYGLSPSVVHDRLGELLATMSCVSLLFCFGLYLKGLHYPSSTDCGSSGFPIFDYYWGTELYPRILGWDVKVFTNCRFGMTVWALLVCINAIKSHETYGFRESVLVTTTLQLLYITKFFWWEGGYYRTLDIIMDRAGYYICWGCLVFVPGLYASVSLYMAANPIDMGWWYSGPLFIIGACCLVVNYLADEQKQRVRHTGGETLVWGSKPDLIRANYHLESGEKREALLLTSGWWGLSRHFHYVPELGLAFSWSAAGGFRHLMPFSYFIVLCILLVHRSHRDDNKCSAKYGKFWVEYCQKVPYRIVPYIF